MACEATKQLPPNQRLQRTRSAPLRSPLSRKPLGDLKQQRRRSRVCGTALVICLVANSSVAGSQFWTRVTRIKFDGVILAGSTTAWTPTERQVLALEKALPSYVAAWQKSHNRKQALLLNDYKRHYSGLRGPDGRRLIRVNFLHKSTDEVRSGGWLTETWIVDGGGESYLEAEYDPGAGRFLSFSINAPF